jgi:hypothetical protein
MVILARITGIEKNVFVTGVLECRKKCLATLTSGY